MDKITWSLLASFSDPEINRFLKYLEWRVSDPKHDCILLTRAWKALKNKDSLEEIEEEKIWAKAFPKGLGKDGSPINQKGLLHKLKGYLEKFLLHEKLVEGRKGETPLVKIERDLQLLFEYQERSLDKAFQKLKKSIRKDLEKPGNRGNDYYRYLYRLNYIEDGYENRTSTKTKDLYYPHLAESYEALEADHLYHGLRLHLIQYNLRFHERKVPQLPPDHPLLEKASTLDRSQYPAIKLMASLINLFKGSKEITLHAIKELYKTYYSTPEARFQFSEGDLNLCRSALSILAKSPMLQGNQGARKIEHQLNILGYQNKSLLINGGLIKPMTYRNVVRMALYQNDISFARRFMEEMKDKIARDVSRRGKKTDSNSKLHHLMEAHCHFYEGELKICKDILENLAEDGNWITPLYYLDACRLNLKLGFKTMDVDSVSSQVAALRTYLNNHKTELAKKHGLLRKMESAFTAMLKIFDLNGWEEWEKVKVEISQSDWFPEKEWMLTFRPAS